MSPSLANSIGTVLFTAAEKMPAMGGPIAALSAAMEWPSLGPNSIENLFASNGVRYAPTKHASNCNSGPVLHWALIPFEAFT